MKIEQLEHIIRAAGAIINADSVIVVGSQSILGQYPQGLPEIVTRSMGADVLPVGDDIEAVGLDGEVIEGALGDGSPFHDLFGIWARGVEEAAIALPGGWKDRLITICNENTRNTTGYCLEVHDLLVSKYVAGCQEDLEYCSAVVGAGLVKNEILTNRLKDTECDSIIRALVEGRIKKDFALP